MNDVQKSTLTRTPNCNHEANTKDKKDKPWFDEKCKRLLKDYKGAIYKFNTCKSFENKQQLLHAKKKYKQYEIKLKVN